MDNAFIPGPARIEPLESRQLLTIVIGSALFYASGDAWAFGNTWSVDRAEPLEITTKKPRSVPVDLAFSASNAGVYDEVPSSASAEASITGAMTLKSPSKDEVTFKLNASGSANVSETGRGEAKGGAVMHFQLEFQVRSTPATLTLRPSKDRHIELFTDPLAGVGDRFTSKKTITLKPRKTPYHLYLTSGIALDTSQSIPSDSGSFSDVMSFELRSVPGLCDLDIDHLAQVMPDFDEDQVDAQFLKSLNDAMEEFDINTTERRAAFLAQLAHESADLTLFSENLNYSAKGLRKTFPKYFTKQQAKDYARKPEKIANRVYADRLGNGNAASGDGWRYRGRGAIQITGKNNYRSVGDALGVDLVKNPDLLATDHSLAFRSAAWHFEERGLNELADKVDPDDPDSIAKFNRKITKKVNGGTNGLEDRLENYLQALLLEC